jgi:hypothetical protein
MAKKQSVPVESVDQTVDPVVEEVPMTFNIADLDPRKLNVDQLEALRKLLENAETVKVDESLDELEGMVDRLKHIVFDASLNDENISRIRALGNAVLALVKPVGYSGVTPAFKPNSGQRKQKTTVKKDPEPIRLSASWSHVIDRVKADLQMHGELYVGASDMSKRLNEDSSIILKVLKYLVQEGQAEDNGGNRRALAFRLIQ